jgi:hypothetical protein
MPSRWCEGRRFPFCWRVILNRMTPDMLPAASLTTRCGLFSGTRILVAGTGAAVRELQAAIGVEAALIPAHTLEQAVRSLHAHEPELLVVDYHFDELRPFRFIRYARDYLGARPVPILLIRALPAYLGATTEAQLCDAYRTLGVDAFCNLFDDAHREGRAAALERLRALLRGLLSV